MSELDLAVVRKTLVERGVLEEAAFEDFLQKAAVKDQLDYLYRVFFAVCELGGAIKGISVTSTRFPWLPEDRDFHFKGALDDLIRYLDWNGEPLQQWSKRIANSRSRQEESSLRKIAKAIYPLILQPAHDGSKAKEEALDLLGQAALELKKEIEKKETEKGTKGMGDWAPELRQIWPS